MDQSVAVIVASAGRSDILSKTLGPVLAAVDGRAQVILSVPDAASLPADSEISSVERVIGARGLTKQRNAGIAALQPSVEFIFFFDDDAVPHPDYLAEAVRVFRETSEVVGVTGNVLYDGVIEGPCDVAQAQRLLSSFRRSTTGAETVVAATLYGCNFAVRRAALADDLRFDERLPLYGWLEDYDFSTRLGRRGRLLTVNDAAVVHMGATNGGRATGYRLGYSQVVIPAYLTRKRSMPVGDALRHVIKPTAKNVLLAAAGPDRAARRNRVRGNVRGLADLARGRCDPERAAELSER